MGVSLDLLPREGQNLILAGAILSIAINPLVFKMISPIQRTLRARSELARKLERSDDPLAELPMTVAHERLTGQVVLVGYGRVGRMIADALTAQGVHFVVAEQNRELVDQLRQRDIPAVAGNAAEPAVLIQAHIANASVLVIATPDTFHARAMIETARALNPSIRTMVRSHNEQEAALLRAEGVGQVFLGEQELARSMTQNIVEQLSAQPNPH
jgi:CPA2 family monovalent cation:H+ antiporter-2